MSSEKPREWTLRGNWLDSQTLATNPSVHAEGPVPAHGEYIRVAELTPERLHAEEAFALLEWAKSAYWARCYQGKTAERVYTLAEFDAQIDALLAKVRGGAK